MLRLLIIILCFTLYLPTTKAQTGGQRYYTDKHPLVFEHSYNLYPYSYINDEGKPEGYFIDIIDMLMKEMGIPYVIELKPQKEALKDLKAGKADLAIGLGDIYDEQFGHYGRITLTLLTQSIVTPRGKAVKVKNFSDLRNEKVTVQDSSMVHHLMVDYGWADNAIVSKEISEEIREINEKGEGQIVWNTPSLKWLIKHYQLNNLKISPVNMPHGECKFISNDPYILDMIERFYEYKYSEGKIKALEDKWFDEQPEPETEAQWHWYVAILGALLLLGAIVYLLIEVRQNRKATQTYHQMTQNLAKVAEHDKYRFWTYYVDEQKYIWHDENGNELFTCTPGEFAKRYNKKDYDLLKEAMDRLIRKNMDSHGHIESEEELELKARDEELGDERQHGFVVHLSVLSRNHHGKPTVIIGTKKDVTKEKAQKEKNQELSLRHLSLFYNNESGILLFDQKGYLQDANQKAGELLMWDIDQAVEKHVHINTILGASHQIKELSEADGMKGVMSCGAGVVDYQVKTIMNENNELIGLYVFCI